jgi:hypothetical protein
LQAGEKQGAITCGDVTSMRWRLGGAVACGELWETIGHPS